MLRRISIGIEKLQRFDMQNSKTTPFHNVQESLLPISVRNADVAEQKPPAELAAKFVVCFIGLQVSYLTWGYMQELIMTTKFTPTPLNPDGLFPSATFCVFSNRFLAVLLAMFLTRMKHGKVTTGVAGMASFAPCSLSNTVSSWAQYASLKYVSFPVQTLFKSSKIIPVMLMGRLLKNTKYPLSQYFEAALITLGVYIFSSYSKEGREESTELYGILCLCVYICSDSFTSQWQSRIYQKYGKPNVDQYQMMLGVNSFSILFTVIALVTSGDIPRILEFLRENSVCFRYNIITAVCSASGQLFIFYTIKEFGPIVFTIIMTTRQLFSICISHMVFGHSLSWKAGGGAAIVFGVIFYQISRKLRTR
ncbi:hypothetical protein ScalyP_jg10528 [Parmales sp. scaly parma]|nr:hypothetical protein ScalyP_jg10528 [Parmales sp. scaly parma]